VFYNPNNISKGVEQMRLYKNEKNTAQEDILFEEIEKGLADWDAGDVVPHEDTMNLLRETIATYEISDN